MSLDKTYFCQALVAVVCVCPAVVLQSSVRAEEIDQADQIQRIRQIVLSRGNDPAGLAHLIQLSSRLPPAAAAELYRQLAEDYLRRGQLEKAADVLRQLVEQYLDQPLAAEGLLTLIRLYSSSEIAHTAKKSLRKSKENALPIYALYLAQQAIGRERDLTNNPAIAFQCAVASRLTGNPRSAKSWLSSLKHNRRLQPWHDCTQAEIWLASPRDEAPPKPTMHCAHTDQRPLLDGVLDEKLWLAAKTQAWGGDSSQIWLAYDEEFFYLAIRCRKVADEKYVSEKLPRSYDADLAGQDHIRLSLDLDRDYATYFQFSIDHRGQTADRCWLNTSWNPRWFVASSSDDTAWTVEAAIPWSELTGNPPQPHAAWALALVRQPATGKPKAWVGPTTKEPAPENFGLLLFD